MKDKKNMKKLFLYVGAIILFIIIATLILAQNKKNQPSKIVACTQEAKQCPDGSSVYRYGLQCQFADCPITETKTEVKDVKSDAVVEKTLTTLNKQIIVKGISITPIEVVEDSRCPIGVSCIWKGVVRIKVKLQTRMINQISELSLNNSVVIADKKISLLSVNPPAIANQIINKANYNFEFSVSNNPNEVNTINGTLDGTMTIGPICPVERIDNPCKPTPQMFAEKKVNVYKGDKKTLVIVLTPDANGKFSIALRAGIY